MQQENEIEQFSSDSICVNAIRSTNYSCGTYLTKPVVPFCVLQETYRINDSLNYILHINGKCFFVTTKDTNAADIMIK